MSHPSNRPWNYSPRRWTDETPRHHAALYLYGPMHDGLIDQLEGLRRTAQTGSIPNSRHCRRWGRS